MAESVDENLNTSNFKWGNSLLLLLFLDDKFFSKSLLMI